MILPQYMVWVGWVFVYDLIFILFTLVNINVYYYVYNCRMSYTVGGGRIIFVFWAFINLNSFYYLN